MALLTINSKTMIRQGCLLFPSFYMEANGKKLIGFVIETNENKVRVFLNNQNDCWIEKETLLDLFNVVSIA